MSAAQRVALVTCAAIAAADDDEDAAPLAAALAGRGFEAVHTVWDDPAVDWDSFDLAVVRSTWDYTDRCAEFLAWADSVPRLRNPAEVLRWNTDKHYLGELAAAGLPVVPTLFVEPGDAVSLPGEGDYVVKPAVSAGGRDTARYGGGQAAAARQHVTALLAAGRTVMVQPYLGRVAEEGETTLIYLDGTFSHGARKGELLTRPDAEVTGLYRPESISPRTPRPDERAAADRILAAAPAGLLYARVDLLPGPDGSPVLLELELAEPSLFLGYSPAAADRFANAIAAAAVESRVPGLRRAT